MIRTPPLLKFVEMESFQQNPQNRVLKKKNIEKQYTGGDWYLVAHPTARKWVITPIFSVDEPYLSHVNHWDYNPFTSRGMSHQVIMNIIIYLLFVCDKNPL